MEKWAKRLAKLAGCTIEIAKEIAEAKLEYKAEKIAEMEARQINSYSAKRETLIRSMERENPLRYIKDIYHAESIVAAHHRHTETDYDEKLSYVHELEEWGIIDRGSAKEMARIQSMEAIINQEFN